MTGFLEIAAVLFVVFLLFGPRRLQNLLRAMGRGISDFTSEIGRDREKKELGGDEDDEAPPR